MPRRRLRFRTTCGLLRPCGLLLLAAALAGCAPPPQRQEALQTLARWEDQRLADPDSLASLLASRDAHVRRAALRAAGLIGRDELLPELVRSLSDRSASVREEAATALGRLGSPAAAGPLAAAALAGDRGLRLAALEALAHVPNDGAGLLEPARRGNASLAAAAWDALRDQAAGVPRDSLLAAIQIGLRRAEHEVQWRVLRCAEKLPDSTLVPLLTPLAHARDIQVRVHALRALGQQRSDGALAALLESGEHEPNLSPAAQARARIALARALARVANGLLRGGPPPPADPELARTAALLAAGSRDRDSAVARTHLDAMAALVEGLPAAPEAAIRESLLPVWRIRLARAAESRLAVPEPAARAAAIVAHAALRGAGGLPRLAVFLDDPDPRLAAGALAAWGRAGGPAELPRLAAVAAAADRPPLVREAALAAAGKLWSRAGAAEDSTLAAAMRPELERLLQQASRDDDFAVAATACGLLGQLPSPGAVAALCEAFARATQLREGADDLRISALEGLAAAVRDSTAVPPALREMVAQTLTQAFDAPDARLRRLGRAAALAGSLLPAASIPSEASLLATLPRAARDPRQPPLTLPHDAPRLRCRTPRGEFVIALDGRVAPNTAAALVSLARAGFYDGLTFHRVVPDFVVQGGDPRGDGWGGPGWTLRCEYSRRPFTRGAVGIAHSGKDTGGSQFFVCQSPQPHLNGRYTLAGEVVRGMHVVDALQPGDTFQLAVEE